MKRFIHKNATDAQLLDRFQSGRDQGAFAELVRRHGAMVTATARRVLTCEHDIEEAFQATFFALAKSIDKLNEKSAVAGWLHKVSRACAARILHSNVRWTNNKHSMRELMDETNAETPPSEDPTGNASSDELKGILDEELAKLPSKLHIALVLCELVGQTQRQAAEQLDISLSTLNSRIIRARKVLRSRLVKRGVLLSGMGLSAFISKSGDTAFAATTAIVTDVSRQAMLFAAGESAAGTELSVRVAETANEVVAAITRAKLISTVAFAALALSLLVGVPLSLQATLASITTPKGTLYFEDFDDGQIADASPVVWNASPGQPGSLDSTSGDLVIGPTNATSPELGVAVGVNDKDTRDTSARTQTRVTETGGFAFLSVRGTYGQISGYFLGVGHAPEFGGSFVVSGIADGAAPRPFQPLVRQPGGLPVVRLPYDVRREDTILQIDAIGDTIEARAWRPGTPMPPRPLFSENEATFPSGGVGIGVRNNDVSQRGTGRSKAIFRFVHVANIPIREESLTEQE